MIPDFLPATHRCKVCGSRWRHNDDGSWSLKRGTQTSLVDPGGNYYTKADICCDNEPMGAQIEELPKPFVQPWYRVCVNCGEQRRNHTVGWLSCLFSPTVFKEAL